jgi:hypothetical protein
MIYVHADGGCKEKGRLSLKLLFTLIGEALNKR